MLVKKRDKIKTMQARSEWWPIRLLSILFFYRRSTEHFCRQIKIPALATPRGSCPSQFS